MSQGLKFGTPSRGRALTAVAVLALALLAVSPHLAPMAFSIAVDGPDSKWHYHWVGQFAQALSEGVFYPRWAAYDQMGLGNPAFLYLHPLFYSLAAILSNATGSPWSAMFLVAALASLISTLIVFLCLRERLPTFIALCCAALVALSPYGFHLSHYQQFLPMHFSTVSLAAFLATFTVPFSQRRFLLTAFAVGLLAISHILVTFIALVISAPALLQQTLRAGSGTALRSLGLYTGSVAAGLGLAGAYLYPALTSQGLITPAAWFEPIHLDWRNSFLFQYFTLPSSGFKWFHLQWTVAAVPAALLFVATFVASISKDRSVEWWLCVDFCVMSFTAFLLGSEVSYWLWQHSVIFQKLQFPLRMLIAATLTSVMAFGFAISILLKANRRRSGVVAMALALGATVLLLAALQYRFVNEAVPTEQVAVPTAAVNGLKVAVPSTARDESLTYVRNGGLANECNFKGAICKEVIGQTHLRSWEISVQEPVQGLRLPLLWFPGWNISLNGVEQDARWDVATGLVAFDLSPGKNVIQAKWKGIYAERVGLGISVLSLILLTAIAVVGRLRRGS